MKEKDIVFKRPEYSIKVRKDYCIACGESKKEIRFEKVDGCFVYGKKIRKTHQYIAYE